MDDRDCELVQQFNKMKNLSCTTNAVSIISLKLVHRSYTFNFSRTTFERFKHCENRKTLM